MPLNEEYWRNVKPSYQAIKEHLKYTPREKLLEIYYKKIDRNWLDPLFLNESIQFLRASIINLCSYKYLMKGHYLSMGKVALYYSYFYIINSLLRLHKYAIVHLDYIDQEPIVIVFEQSSDANYYFAKKCGQSQHKLIWNQFEKYYPELISPGIGKFFRDERSDWNYDLFYISQATMEHSIEETNKRYENNFLDKNYGQYYDERAAEYYYDLMADIGYEEVGVGKMIEYVIGIINRLNLNDIKELVEDDLSKIESSDDTKSTIISYFLKQ